MSNVALEEGSRFVSLRGIYATQISQSFFPSVLRYDIVNIDLLMLLLLLSFVLFAASFFALAIKKGTRC
jgi:hypothetical protein